MKQVLRNKGSGGVYGQNCISLESWRLKRHEGIGQAKSIQKTCESQKSSVWNGKVLGPLTLESYSFLALPTSVYGQISCSIPRVCLNIMLCPQSVSAVGSLTAQGQTIIFSLSV